jgi:hypothetical protein
MEGGGDAEEKKGWEGGVEGEGGHGEEQSQGRGMRLRDDGGRLRGRSEEHREPGYDTHHGCRPDALLNSSAIESVFPVLIWERVGKSVSVCSNGGICVLNCRPLKIRE